MHGSFFPSFREIRRRPLSVVRVPFARALSDGEGIRAVIWRVALGVSCSACVRCAEVLGGGGGFLEVMDDGLAGKGKDDGRVRGCV